MPLDEKEKEALKERYKEHRQAMWFGKHSRKSKKKKPRLDDEDNFVNPTQKEEIKARISAKQPMKSVTIIEDDAVAKKQQGSGKLSEEKNDRIVILSRTKEKKSISETPTKIMPPTSERTTIYEPELPPKAKAKLSSPDDKKTILQQDKPLTPSSSSTNVAELSTRLEATVEPSSSTENILKEKIKDQRQEIWSGASSKKRRRSKSKEKNGKKSEENSHSIAAQDYQPNSQAEKEGLTLGIVFIGIAAVVAAVVLGVLLGYILA